jgi:3-keto-disaccharide hydrolase
MLLRKYFLIGLCLMMYKSYAQQKNSNLNYSVIHPAEWVIPKDDTLSYAFEKYEAADALLLKRNFLNYKSASIAYPIGLDFKDGIIECDIACPAGKNGFAGVAFRIKDPHHYETLYFRPGSSGTANAIQYMPEKKQEFNWWDYEDLKYQAKATIPLTGWFHVKAVVKGKRLTVYLNNQSTPAFTYNLLDDELSNGSVGFWLGNCTSGAFKNLIVKKL